MKNKSTIKKPAAKKPGASNKAAPAKSGASNKPATAKLAAPAGVKTTAKPAPKKTTAAAKNATPSKRKRDFAQASKNVSEIVKPGTVGRSRDEFFKDGFVKNRENDKPDQYYRKIYVVDTNNLDELAVVKSTAKLKGIPLKSGRGKFRPTVYIQDDERKMIKFGPKFVRVRDKNLPLDDVAGILDECEKYPDTLDKIAKLKSRRTRKPSTPTGPSRPRPRKPGNGDRKK